MESGRSLEPFTNFRAAGFSFLAQAVRWRTKADSRTPPYSPGRAWGTLYIDAIDQLGEAGQDRLNGLLDPTRHIVVTGEAALRLVTSADRNIGELVDEGRFLRDLYYRITLLTVELPPLRQRRHDIPALADALAEDICALLGLPPVSFTARASDRLVNYLWYGNLSELESVLARTLAIHRPTVIDAKHLLFETTAILPLPGESERRAAAREDRTTAGPALEVIANEIAHELRNPMATVKSFAQLAEHLLGSKTDHQMIAQLAAEAVDRMDGIIENLLRFARFRTPVRRPIALAGIVSGPTTEFAHMLEPHGGRLEIAAPPRWTILADSDQMELALTNLFSALARRAKSGAEFACKYLEPATLLLQLPPSQQRIDAKLAAMVDDAEGVELPLSLGFVIARSLIENNGGELSFDETQEPPMIAVQFELAPSAEEVDSGNEQSPRLDRR